MVVCEVFNWFAVDEFAVGSERERDDTHRARRAPRNVSGSHQVESQKRSQSRGGRMEDWCQWDDGGGGE